MKETLNITKFTEWMSESNTSELFILNKINNELSPNEIIYDAQNLMLNNRAKLFEGDLDHTITYLNGMYQGIILLKIKK